MNKAVTKKPLIAIFLATMHGGGVERMRLNLARAFLERGYRVDLVLATVEGPNLAHVPPAVNIVDLHAGRVLLSLPALVRYLRRARPDALLAGMNHANIVALWARRMAGVPARVVISIHNTLSISSRNATRRDRLVPWFAARCYGWAEGVVAVSNGVADDLSATIGLPRAGIEVINNPVVVPELATQAAAPVDHPWFGAGEPPVLLSVGRLTAQKDYPMLLRAFAEVRTRRPARLIILGEGGMRAELEARISEMGLAEAVSLPGFMPNPYAFMSAAAVFVLSSAWEGFGNVLVEALAVGTPVIATDCPSGPAEILGGGRYGRLVPVGDSTAMAEAIVAVLDSPPPPAVLRQRSVGYAYDAVAARYLALLTGSREG